jgi:hypothetical protein
MDAKVVLVTIERTVARNYPKFSKREIDAIQIEMSGHERVDRDIARTRHCGSQSVVSFPGTRVAN